MFFFKCVLNHGFFSPHPAELLKLKLIHYDSVTFLSKCPLNMTHLAHAHFLYTLNFRFVLSKCQGPSQMTRGYVINALWVPLW